MGTLLSSPQGDIFIESRQLGSLPVVIPPNAMYNSCSDKGVTLFLKDASRTAIVDAAVSLKPGETDVILVFLGEKSGVDVEKLIQELKKKKVVFAGGIFPGLISDGRKHDAGAILMKVRASAKPLAITGLKSELFSLPASVQEASRRVTDHNTALVLVDGFAPNISALLGDLFNTFGSTVHYFGGGAGFSSLKQQPCLFTADGFFENAALVVFLRTNSSLGVRHGWTRLAGPVVATKARHNILSQLNWQDAFSVYRELVARDSGRRLTRDNFSTVAAGYPFGIIKEGAEDSVRDPLSVNAKGEILCVGEIPENAVLNILKGDCASLLAAAIQAAEDCTKGTSGKARQSFVFDCVSRSLFAGDEFSKELAAVEKTIMSKGGRTSPEGVLSIGEICSYGEGFLDFFNKTIVVGTLCDA